MGRRPRQQNAHIRTLEIAQRRKVKWNGDGDLEGAPMQKSQRSVTDQVKNRTGNTPYRQQSP